MNDQNRPYQVDNQGVPQVSNSSVFVPISKFFLRPGDQPGDHLKTHQGSTRDQPGDNQGRDQEFTWEWLKFYQGAHLETWRQARSWSVDFHQVTIRWLSGHHQRSTLKNICCFMFVNCWRQLIFCVYNQPSQTVNGVETWKQVSKISSKVSFLNGQQKPILSTFVATTREA